VKQSVDRILTTHVGSLVRTPEIVEIHIKEGLGEPVDSAEYEEALRSGVAECVRQQGKVGVDVIDDGEYGKRNWIAYLRERLNGMVPTDEKTDFDAEAKTWPEQRRYADFYRAYVHHESDWLPAAPSRSRYAGSAHSEYTHVACRGPLQYRPEALMRDIRNLRQALEGVQVAEAFMPVVAPGSIELIRNEHYASPEEYLFALARELNKEYRLIVDAGFVLQVDDAVLTQVHTWRFRHQPMAAYQAWAEVRIEALNRALEGIPEDRVRYHICFGSHNMPHTTDLNMRDLIGLVLRVRAQGYSLEASNPRHEHEWQLWRDVKLPPGKVLLPGVIGHATNIVEHPELVAMRIENFAKLVGRENVIASSDCGFSQGWNTPRVHAQIQWAKLEALVEGARIASERLWGRKAA